VAIITAQVHDDQMTATVIHQPRVAWDGARAFVRITTMPYYEAFAEHVRNRLGPQAYADLEDTHERMVDNLRRTGGDRYVPDVEAGKWRFRLEDLLRNRPDMAGTVLDLTAMVPR
jgi:hypothetical protein